LNRSILFRGKLAKLQSKTSFVWLNLLQKIQTATQAEKCKKKLYINHGLVGFEWNSMEFLLDNANAFEFSWAFLSPLPKITKRNYT